MHHALQSLIEYQETAALHFHTLGRFSTVINDREINAKDWGRDKTIQLIQFFITSRHRKGLHKEQIIDRLWPDSSSESMETVNWLA